MNNIKSGLFIKEKRNEKGLTQKDLAKILNCTDKAVSRWETGKGFPEVSFLIPLSEALDVSVNEIILGEEIKKEEIIEKTNNVIVETLKETKRKINKASYIIFALLLTIEALMFYYTQLAASPGDEMGIIFANIAVVIICSFLVGFVNLKLQFKLIFIPATIILFIPSSFLYFPFDPEYTFGYSAFFAVSSLILILFSSGIQKIIIELKHRISKK
ncbi:MAG: helix-turn-helix domain-containing protein [Eubacterium sp.]|nr:helix-turn-helix domain-containing protein [Eubacterium sp.]